MDTQTEGDVLVEWWLDESALPDLYWARLKIFHDGKSEVFDLNGATHRFATIEEGRAFLRDDEYSPLQHVIEDGLVEGSPQPPPSFLPDAQVFPDMVKKRKTP